MEKVSKFIDNIEYELSELCEEQIDATAVLLNSEWPRSMTLRVRSLQSSITTYGQIQLPKSIILVNTQANQVIGHLKLNFIQIANESGDNAHSSVYLQ